MIAHSWCKRNTVKNHLRIGFFHVENNQKSKLFVKTSNLYRKTEHAIRFNCFEPNLIPTVSVGLNPVEWQITSVYAINSHDRKGCRFIRCTRLHKDKPFALEKYKRSWSRFSCQAHLKLQDHSMCMFTYRRPDVVRKRRALLSFNVCSAKNLNRDVSSSKDHLHWQLELNNIVKH